MTPAGAAAEKNLRNAMVSSDPNRSELHPNDPNVGVRKRLLYSELSYRITGLCFQVQNELGRFCRERQYSDKLEELVQKEKITYQREFEIHTMAADSPLGNRADFIIESAIILDAKAKRFITKEDYYQMLRYLSGARLELGLIVNFRSSYLKPKRVLNNEFVVNSDHSGAH